MTSYEQYEAVMSYLKSEWTDTPIFTADEPINEPLPYLVISSYGIGNRDVNTTTRMDIRGYSIKVYASHRGKVESLLSDALDKFNGSKTTEGNLDICNIQLQGEQIKLEDEVFEGELNFSVKSFKR